MCIYAGESRAEVGKRTEHVMWTWKGEGQRNEGRDGEQPTKVNTTSKPVTLDTN